MIMWTFLKTSSQILKLICKVKTNKPKQKTQKLRNSLSELVWQGVRDRMAHQAAHALLESWMLAPRTTPRPAGSTPPFFDLNLRVMKQYRSMITFHMEKLSKKLKNKLSSNIRTTEFSELYFCFKILIIFQFRIKIAICISFLNT